MSIKESNRRKLASRVFKSAWALFKKGSKFYYSFSNCLKICWRTVRGLAKVNFSKAKGVTFKNANGTSRQAVLKALTKYPLNQLALHLKREADNPYDPNAIKIIVTVTNKGSAQVGYVSKEIAIDLAVQMDLGKRVTAYCEGITGLNHGRLGLNYSYVLQ